MKSLSTSTFIFLMLLIFQIPTETEAAPKKNHYCSGRGRYIGTDGVCYVGNQSTCGPSTAVNCSDQIVDSEVLKTCECVGAPNPSPENEGFPKYFNDDRCSFTGSYFPYFNGRSRPYFRVSRNYWNCKVTIEINVEPNTVHIKRKLGSCSHESYHGDILLGAEYSTIDHKQQETVPSLKDNRDYNLNFDRINNKLFYKGTLVGSITPSTRNTPTNTPQPTIDFAFDAYTQVHLSPFIPIISGNSNVYAYQVGPLLYVEASKYTKKTPTGTIFLGCGSHVF